MNYKLVCIDMDGTLLDSHHRVSERNKEALKKAIEKRSTYCHINRKGFSVS